MQRRPSAIAERRLDPDRRIALEALPASIRPAFAALWNIDLALADVVSTSTDPLLGAIRLAWWRERLDELNDRARAPAEPRLQAVANELLTRMVTGGELSRLEDAWLPLLEPFPWAGPQAEGLKLRGRLLFGIGAKLLGGDVQETECAGELWSLQDGACHCTDMEARAFLVSQARECASRLPLRVSPLLRPLTILAALAAYDVAPAGRFGRGGAALKHRLTGLLKRSH